MKAKAFSSSDVAGLAVNINKFFNELEDYAIWHISNVIKVIEKHGYRYFKIIIFYDEEVEDLPK